MSAPDLSPLAPTTAYVTVMDLYLLMVAVMTVLFVLVFILVSLEVESAE